MTQEKIKQKFLFSYNEPEKTEPTQLYFLVYEAYSEQDEKLIEGLKNHLIKQYGEENVKVEELPVTEFDQKVPGIIKEEAKLKSLKGE